jgi:multidrug efflux pump subunit AcrB
MNSKEPQKDNFSGLYAVAIRSPHLVIVVCLVVIILGGLSLSLLPKDLLPASNLPAVQILSFYPGMPVEHVEKNLTSRFERYTGQAIDIQRQESRSLTGVSVVKNFFGTATDLNTAISQTTSLVMSVLRRLPPGTQPPLILPFDPTATVPLALVAVSGDMSEKDLYDKARYEVRNTIQSVTGAMAPTVMGGAERQVVVFLDPKKLEKFNFSSLDVINKLDKLNTFVPSGSVKIGTFDYQILSNGIADRIDDMNEFPLRSENGTTVLLKDVGKATDYHKIQTNIVMVDGKRQVYVPIYRQPGANSISVVDQVKTSLEKLGKNLNGINLKLVADQSGFIRKAISSITEETMIGGGLAAIMVLLFLGNPSATFGILLSLPLSLLAAFLGLKATGQTVNAMTLGGLALAIGVLVDNSIVVLENITQKIKAGMPPRLAALQGTKEVAMPVLSSTLATLVVFFPVLFLTGIVKTLFSALALSVLFAMIGSYFASMTVIPLFSAHFLKSAHEAKEKGKFFSLIESIIEKLTALYGRLLEKSFKKTYFILGGASLLLVISILLVPKIGTELFPKADAGSFVLSLRLPSGTRIEETEKFAVDINKKLRQWIPSEDLAMIITNAGVYYGFPAAFTPNSGPQDVFFNIQLSEHRIHTSQYYAKILRAKISETYPKTEMGFELGGLLSSALNGGLKSPIDIQIEGPKFEKAHEIADQLKEKIKNLRGAVDVRIQQRLDAPQIMLAVDRKKSGELGLSTDEVIKNIVSAVSGSSSFNSSIWVDPTNGIDYLLGVQFSEDTISSLNQLLQIPITGSKQERSVPLSKLVKLTHVSGPSELNHVNLKSVVDIFTDAEDRDVGGLSKDIQKVVNDTALPQGYSISLRGEIAEMNRSIGSLGGGFLLAAILVYLILVVQFKSFLLPAIIMVTVPIGLSGIILMFVFSHTYFSIQAAIGAIFMIGIAVANGVLLIEFIIHRASESNDLNSAIITGAKARLRPILMTALASVLGLVPMAIGLGHGAEANIPLGRAVIGGQLVSMPLTLFIVPLLFRLSYRHKKHQRIGDNLIFMDGPNSGTQEFKLEERAEA